MNKAAGYSGRQLSMVEDFHISNKISGFQARFQDFVSDFKISAKISYRV